ncbi:hypothetical protein GOODEAATRI_029104, partial [Goodea atripinnis]
GACKSGPAWPRHSTTKSSHHHFLSSDVYHQIFVRPDDDTITRRLEWGQGPSEEKLLAELQCYRCEVTGLRSAYQHVLKVINGDQPPADVYQQGGAPDGGGG